MASELEDEIKLSNEALMGPLVLAKNLEEAYQVALKISSVKGVETFMKKGATSTKELREETVRLSKDTQALVGVQKSLAVAIEKDAKAYEDETKVIKQLNAETKKQMSTSDTQITKYNKLKGSLDQTRQALSKHTTEESRATKEAQDLLATIQKQDDELKKLREQLKNNNKEQEKSVSALTKLKQQYKELQSQMIEVGAEFGVESEQFAKIAEEAGAVKDEIGDLQEATNAVSGEPIERLSGSFDLFKGKLATLDVKGATNGIRGMTNAAKGLNFKEAISGAGGLTKAVGALGKALLTNPIFLIAAIIIGIGVALFALKDKIKIVSQAFDAMGEALDWIIQQGKDFLDFVGLTTFALDDMTKQVVEDLEKQRKKWEELYDDQIKLLSAAGKSTVDAEKAKQKAIADTTAAAIAQYKKQAEEGSELTEDQIKDLDELVKANHDANIELVAIALRTQKELDDAAKEREKKAKEARLREEGDAFKLQQFLLQNEIEKNKKIVADDKATFDARMDAAQKVADKQKELSLLEFDQGFNDPDAGNSAKLLAEAKYQQDLTDITIEAEENRTSIIKSNQDQELKNIQEFVAARKDEIAKSVQDSVNAIDTEIQTYTQKLIDAGYKTAEIEAELAKKRKSLVDDYIKAEIEGQREILKINELSGEERAAAEQKLHELKIALTNAYYDQLEDREKGALDKLEEFLNKWKQAYNDFGNAIGDLFAANTAKRLAELDKQSEAVKAHSDEQIELSKAEEEDALKRSVDNEEIKAGIKEAYAEREKSLKDQAAKQEERIDAQRRKMIRRQAQIDKAIALSQAGMNLASAIVAMLKVGPAGFALSAIAAAIGAVQVATIAATPIPAAEKGIRGHKGGAILAGEKGTELIEEPGGKLSLTHDTPHIYDLPAGTNIYSATDPKTTRALAGKDLRVGRRDRPPVQRDITGHELLRQVIRTIKAKPSTIVRGVIEGSRVHDTYIQQSKNAR